MLPNINILYLGCGVLALMDLSYMSRFWTQVCKPDPAAPHNLNHVAPPPLSVRHSLAVSDLLTFGLRTQFEAWLSFQKPTRRGLVSAPPAERRCTVRSIHNAPTSQEAQLVRMWAGMTAKGAHDVLSKPDVVVTNRSDKDEQLPKLLKLDQMVSDCMNELELSLSRMSLAA